jgi:4-amino-4-deoxy-L-arabinose transferase-like glycosyltransferase
VTRRRATAAALLFALCVGLRLVSLVTPCLSDDEATYAVVAREMLGGRVLYRDVVDHKPPLIYVTYAATQVVAGPVGGMRLLHGLLIGVVFATALLVGRVARRLAAPGEEERDEGLAALLYVVFTTTALVFDGLAANCELFMMLPLVGSVLLVRSPWRAGLLLGVAVLYKYQAGIMLPLYAAALLWRGRARPVRALAQVALLGAAAAAPVAVALGLLARAGALAEALRWFRFNFAYIATGSGTLEAVTRLGVRAGFAVGAAALLWILGVGAAVRRWRTPDGHGDGRLAVGWLVASVAAVLVGGRFFGHYFHQTTAPLAALAAAPLGRLLRGPRRGLGVAAIAVPAAAFLVLGVFHGRVLAAVGEPEPGYPAVAAWIEARSHAGDPICIWGNSPVLHFELPRHPLGCRFVFANYLSGLSPATSTQSDPRVDASANIVPAAWDMLEADLAARRPIFVLDASPGDVGHYGKFPPAKFPRLRALLDRDYQAEAVVAGLRIWRRRDAVAATETDVRHAR